MDDPVRYIHPLWGIVSEIAADWDHGITPNGRGMMAQPARLLAAVRLHRSAINHCKNVMHEQQMAVYGGA